MNARRAFTLATLVMTVAACGLPVMRGANYVQSPTVPWDSPAAARSLERLRDTGANWVAFVPFMTQSATDACDLTPSRYSQPDELEIALIQARSLGFHISIKPQILVPGSWAGEVSSGDEAAWACWFTAYSNSILIYAALAAKTGADEFVLGTELKKTEHRPEWRDVVAALRRHYSGSLTYTFHDLADAPRFAALDLLNRVGVSVYPAIGNDPTQQLSRISAARDHLRSSARALGKPVWIAEIGYPSRHGAGDRPWEWNSAADQPRPDPDSQARILRQWIEHLNGDWNQGILIWNWTSDPDAGGLDDTDFTPQNKPAEVAIACLWRGTTCFR